jgi:predicted nucleic acid-binding Zn ribbon protein
VLSSENGCPRDAAPRHEISTSRDRERGVRARLPARKRDPILRLVAARSPTPAGAVLADLVDRLEFRERLREHAVWNVWEEVVGTLLSSKAEPVRIEDGKLFVAVANSAWMQELQFLKDDIRNRLNHRLGGLLVREIFLVLGAAKRRQRKEPPAKIHPVDESAIRDLVPDLGLPDLEAAIRRVARARARRLGPAGMRDDA